MNRSGVFSGISPVHTLKICNMEFARLGESTLNSTGTLITGINRNSPIRDTDGFDNRNAETRSNGSSGDKRTKTIITVYSKADVGTNININVGNSNTRLTACKFGRTVTWKSLRQVGNGIVYRPLINIIRIRCRGVVNIAGGVGFIRNEHHATKGAHGESDHRDGSKQFRIHDERPPDCIVTVRSGRMQPATSIRFRASEP